MGCGKRIGGTNLNRIRPSIIRIVSREIMRDFLFSSLDFRSSPFLRARNAIVAGGGRGWRTWNVGVLMLSQHLHSLLLAARRTSGRPKFTTLQILECNLEICNSLVAAGISW